MQEIPLRLFVQAGDGSRVALRILGAESYSLRSSLQLVISRQKAKVFRINSDFLYIIQCRGQLHGVVSP